MSVITRIDKLILKNASKSAAFYCTAAPQEDKEFRVLNLKQMRSNRVERKAFRRTPPPPPRSKQMKVNQDWGNVWTGPRTFHPATVPLPIRQGYEEKSVAPGKYANAELMKIPNFLHLTPPVIKRQCEALKQFCTSWPKLMTTDEACTKHFPLEVIRSTYCHSSPTIRDPMARIVTIHFPLDRLTLDTRARDKFLRLVGERYSEKTGLVTIVADRCPSWRQNYDYVMYLLTAVYHESWRVEAWEALKTDADMEVYAWSNSPSQKNVEAIFSKAAHGIEHINDYTQALTTLMNEGESEYTVGKYGDAVKKLLNVSQ